jgi:anaerobic C4-dicarboxylate transporter
MIPTSLFGLVALIVVASTISSIVRSAFGYKYRARRLGGDPEFQQRIEQSVRELGEQMGQLREDVVDLGERLDFAERMLVRGREDARLGDGR